MLLPKREYIRDKKHRKFISSLPCLICFRTDTQAAHIRSLNGAGMGLKSGDNCTVPLCVDCHTTQHTMSEKEFWERWGGLDYATRTAKNLYAVTGKTMEAMKVIGEFG